MSRTEEILADQYYMWLEWKPDNMTAYMYL